ncbi:MAG: tetratricopeptide repeat protein [archaeon]|nr:tetratricopeptide repeat protein [archaeon]
MSDKEDNKGEDKEEMEEEKKEVEKDVLEESALPMKGEKKNKKKSAALDPNLDDEIEKEEGEEGNEEDNKGEDEKDEEEKKEEKIPPPAHELSDNSLNSLNYLAHYYFVRNEFVECLATLSKCSKTDNNFEDFYSIFIKALIKRNEGDINESLKLFKQSYTLNDSSYYILRETGKNFLLLGKYSMAIEIYDSLIGKDEEDWDSLYHKGLCLMNMGQYDEATELFDRAYEINPTPEILKAQAKMLILQENLEEAVKKYEEALYDSIDDVDLLAKVGALKLKMEETDSALECFEQAININPNYSSGILGLSSIYQSLGDYEKSFNLYKLSQKSNPNSAIVWNNIGLCFLATNKYIYATSCLTKAYYLEPFTWEIAFNLGMALMSVGLYASAFIYMNAAEKLKNDDYKIYMFLGIILGELSDTNNATASYEKALSFGENYLVTYNMTITYIKNDMIPEASAAYNRFKGSFGGGEEDYDVDIQDTMPLIESILQKGDAFV